MPSTLCILSQTNSRGRAPARLKITIKLAVVKSDYDDLKLKYAQVCSTGELLLIVVLRNHFERVILETRDTIRDISNTTYTALKKANVAQTKSNMEDAFKTANSERTKRKEQRK